MKIYAKVVEVGELISGTSDNGNDWEKQQVVFETTHAATPKHLAIDFMGERKTKTTKTLQKGQLCEVVFEPTSRKWEDKWFTNLEGYAVTPLVAADAPKDTVATMPPEEELPY